MGSSQLHATSPAAPPPGGTALPGPVAREAELAAIGGLLARDPATLRALVLEGEPGIGKTTLWERGVARGRECGARLLVARPSETETGLPFAGLIDLLDGVATDELSSLPDPQLHALEVALYRVDPGEHPPSEQAVALALLSALRALAARDRLLLAVDDLQWLDPASQSAVAYAVRRLLQEDVTVLLARRPGPPTSVEAAFAEDRIDRVVVRGTSLGATRQILAGRLGLRLPHHLLRRVYDTTMGNPLFALEIGRMLASLDLDSLGEDLPVPDAVDDLLGLRVADLEPTARRVLLALSLDADLRLGQLRLLAGEDAVEVAVAAGVVQVEGDRVRAAHPLLAAVAKRAAPDDAVRTLHADLAAVVGDEQRRVLHLALAATVPDAALADRLDAAVERAAARGATRLAVDLAAHAWRLTDPEAPVAARVISLARLLNNAGEKRRLTQLLGPLADSFPDRVDRVRAHLLLTGGVVRDNDDIRDRLQRALDAAGDDDALRLRVLCHLAENEAVIEVRHVGAADERAAEAVTAAEGGSVEDQWLAVYTRVWTASMRGLAVDRLVERYGALPGEPTYLARLPARVLGQRHVWRGELGPARARLEAYRALAAERAEPSPYALARLHLCELELRAGRWDAAEELLDEWAASPDSALLHWPMYERCRGLLLAGRGDAEAARDWAERAASQAEAMGVRWDWLEATRTLGVAALLAKDPAEAVRHLRRVWEHTGREGVLDPGAFPAAPDLVEALVELGSAEEARPVAADLAAAAEQQDHPWARLAAHRGAALVALSSDGWSEEHADLLAAVAATYADLGLAFDSARTWLALGRAQRRARKWGAARDALGRAVTGFEAMGSPGWAADARTELDRVGARRPSGAGRLTSTERRVADLAAGGLSNKQVARTLVVTVSTVEFHLRNAYGKLGIRSRMELAGRLRELDGP